VATINNVHSLGFFSRAAPSPLQATNANGHPLLRYAVRQGSYYTPQAASLPAAAWPRSSFPRILLHFPLSPPDPRLFNSHTPPHFPPKAKRSKAKLQSVLPCEKRGGQWGSCWWSLCTSSSSPSFSASAASSSASTGAGRRCEPASARRSTARRCRRPASSESHRRRLSRFTPRNQGPKPSDWDPFVSTYYCLCFGDVGFILSSLFSSRPCRGVYKLRVNICLCLKIVHCYDLRGEG
jgi:hypothetical protein